MTRVFLALIASMSAVAALAATNPAPKVVSAITPGMWELSGLQSSSGSARECIRDLGRLLQVEHGNRQCKRTVVADHDRSALVEYRCGDSEFGRSELTLLTPRSLRIQTQGISGGLPFNYVVQARRVGECQP